MEHVPHLRPRRPAGRLAGAIIADRFKGKRVAIVHDKTTYGQGLADETRKAMAKGGLKEVLYEGVNKDDKDFTALVSKLTGASPDLVYWGGLHDAGGMIVRQMRDQGLKAPLMGGDGITDDEFAAIAGPGAEGTLMTFSPDPRTNPANKEIVELFRKKRMFEPQAYTLYSYAAVQIIKQAAEQAKSLDPKKVAEVMHSGKVFKTVLGDISFDKKGDVSTTATSSAARRRTATCSMSGARARTARSAISKADESSLASRTAPLCCYERRRRRRAGSFMRSLRSWRSSTCVAIERPLTESWRRPRPVASRGHGTGRSARRERQHQPKVANAYGELSRRDAARLPDALGARVSRATRQWRSRLDEVLDARTNSAEIRSAADSSPG